MQTVNNHSAGTRRAVSESQQFPYAKPELVNRPTVPTEQADYLNRRPQTCRAWACFENGPLRPFRINGRLAWFVVNASRVLGVV